MDIPQFNYGPRSSPVGTTVILKVITRDKTGLVKKFVNFISDHNGNIVSADEHHDPANNLFITRREWELEGFLLPREDIIPAFKPIGELVGGHYEIRFSDEEWRLGVLVTWESHCLFDLIDRSGNGKLPGKLACVISNRPALRELVERLGYPFFELPIAPNSKGVQEEKILEILRQQKVNLVALAKYMQILGPSFLSAAPPTINIHHSLLPDFEGADPYSRAYECGVKRIGATAHYVTEKLDGGPIIAQDCASINHRDTVADIKRKGHEVESRVLAKAVRAHMLHRVLVYRSDTAPRGRTVVFD